MWETLLALTQELRREKDEATVVNKLSTQGLNAPFTKRVANTCNDSTSAIYCENNKHGLFF